MQWWRENTAVVLGVLTIAGGLSASALALYSHITQEIYYIKYEQGVMKQRQEQADHTNTRTDEALNKLSIKMDDMLNRIGDIRERMGGKR